MPCCCNSHVKAFAFRCMSNISDLEFDAWHFEPTCCKWLPANRLLKMNIKDRNFSVSGGVSSSALCPCVPGALFVAAYSGTFMRNPENTKGMTSLKSLVKLSGFPVPPEEYRASLWLAHCKYLDDHIIWHMVEPAARVQGLADLAAVVAPLDAACQNWGARVRCFYMLWLLPLWWWWWWWWWWCFLFVCLHACVHAYIHPSIHRYIRTYVHTYTRKHVHTYILTSLHTYIRTYIAYITYITNIHNIT